MEFIELQRRFRDLKDAQFEDTEAPSFLEEYGFGPAFGWSDLLENARVVLLAQAGAGKSWEMEERAKRLVGEGQTAFFLRLEYLDSEPIDAILSPAENDRFEAWKEAFETPAWFFLDAVDELKLTQGKLDRALRRLSNDINGYLHRARVVISCRPSDWRPSTDLATVKHRLPVPTGEGAQSSEQVFITALKRDGSEPLGITHGKAETPNVAGVRTVAMLPMNDAQITRFAEKSGVADATAFLDEIRIQNARAFAERPLDLSDLIATWRSYGRLGTRSEQHETSVTGKLKDNPERPDRGVLTDDKAQLGAERLALALSLTRTRSVRSLEQALRADGADGILDPSKILTDWTEAERQALLRRALFDPATYGRVLFHHRSVQEYLAARHLRTLRERGMSTKALLRLLFAERYGVEVVFPSTRAIAAWLALWDDAVRRELIRREPETLLSHGDPEALDLATKGDILREFVARYGQGSWRGLDIQIDQLRRLAQPELAPVIRECWGNGPVNDDVRHLLVRMIWLGPVPDCADLAQTVAFDVTWPVSDRIAAIRALVACSRDDAVRQVAGDMLARPGLWVDEIVWGVAADLFPKVLTVYELVTLMEQTPEPADIIGGFGTTSLKIVEALDPRCESATLLRDRLAALVWEGRAETQEFYDIRGSFNYLAPALATLCERQLSAAPGQHDAVLIRCCVIASRFCGDDWNAREPIGKLREHFKVNPARRSDAFWAELAFMDEVVPAQDDWRRCYRALHDGLLDSLTETDRPWLLEGLSNEGRPERRAVALLAYIDLWRMRGGVDSELGDIRARLQGDQDLLRIFHECTAPPNRSESMESMEIQHQRLQAAEVRRKEEREALPSRLVADPDAFSPEKRDATVDALYSWLYQYKYMRGSNSCNVWDKDALKQAFGGEVAERAEAAFRTLWRKAAPLLWSTRPSTARNTISPKWLHGFVGVSAEATTAGWADSLSPEEARIAVAYTTIELGGFASFIGDLANSYSEEVIDVIGQELSAELRIGEEDSYLPALQGLVNAETNVKRLFIPHLFDELRSWPEVSTGEAGQHWAQHLDNVLYIFGEATSGTDRAAIAQECINRYEANRAGPLAPVWLKGLFRFDAPKGVQVLTETLIDRDNPALRKLAVELFATFFGDHHALVIELEDPALQAQVIGQLVRLAHAFVRPTEDQVLDGMFSPDARDHAEQARGALLAKLLNTPGAEARRVVLELARLEEFAHLRDRLRFLARQRAAADAEFAPFDTDAVSALENRYEAPPQDRDGLFALMMDRLEDIALDLAGGDFTDRPTLQRVDKEPEMQVILARRFREVANGAYSVTREEEVAAAKHPDIRLWTIDRGQIAAVEVKIADNDWTVKDLENALRDQLVGQYLRDPSCKAGCLLLTYHGRKQYWVHPVTGKHLGFSELVAHLDEKARDIEYEKSYHVRVAVFGLDLTDP